MQFAVFMLSKTVGEISLLGAGEGLFISVFLICFGDVLFLNFRRRRSELRFILIFFSFGQIWVPHYVFNMMWVLVTFHAVEHNIRMETISEPRRKNRIAC